MRSIDQNFNSLKHTLKLLKQSNGHHKLSVKQILATPKNDNQSTNGEFIQVPTITKNNYSLPTIQIKDYQEFNDNLIYSLYNQPSESSQDFQFQDLIE